MVAAKTEERLGGIRWDRAFYLLRYYLRARRGKKDPILCGVKLTHRCNLRCRQCPYWRRPGPSLTWKQLEELFPRLRERGIRIVIFEGGEPFLWRDGEYTLRQVVDLARRYFWTVGVTTNGTVDLNGVNPNLIWVSIDGFSPTNAVLRGTPLEPVLANIERYRGEKRIFANITISRGNWQEIPDLVKFLADYVAGITIQFFYPYPESEDLFLPWEERRWVLDRLIELKRQGYPLADSYAALEALKDNRWRCESWMIANVEPDGTFNHGCYLLNRTDDTNPCPRCGFAAHTEISLAFQLNFQALLTGRKILEVF
ncbi:MAG: hypothetical protein PWQ91_298 [Eubacteriales bacterium]|nr:hypothetical protein [Eubacteriales bacterium]MDN5363237.1 hypothetical protein [Eubacteriales bacterium]